MKRSEIKVGRVYGVRAHFGERADVVPAKVVSLAADYNYRIGRYGRENQVAHDGVEVEFTKQTRVADGYYGFSLAAKTNSNAGPVTPRYVFGDKKNGSVGRCFVGLWSDLERERKAGERARREHDELLRRRADAFEPALNDFMRRLRGIGLNVEVERDASGICGDVEIPLQTNGSYGIGKYRRRATGFTTWADVGVPFRVFEKMLDAVEAAGVKIEVEEEDEGDD